MVIKGGLCNHPPMQCNAGNRDQKRTGERNIQLSMVICTQSATVLSTHFNTHRPSASLFLFNNNNDDDDSITENNCKSQPPNKRVHSSATTRLSARQGRALCGPLGG